MKQGRLRLGKQNLHVLAVVGMSRLVGQNDGMNLIGERVFNQNNQHGGDHPQPWGDMGNIAGTPTGKKQQQLDSCTTQPMDVVPLDSAEMVLHKMVVTNPCPNQQDRENQNIERQKAQLNREQNTTLDKNADHGKEKERRDVRKKTHGRTIRRWVTSVSTNIHKTTEKTSICAMT